jgi:hypothetical protein
MDYITQRSTKDAREWEWEDEKSIFKWIFMGSEVRNWGSLTKKSGLSPNLG